MGRLVGAVLIEASGMLRLRLPCRLSSGTSTGRCSLLCSSRCRSAPIRRGVGNAGKGQVCLNTYKSITSLPAILYLTSQ